MVQQPFEWGYQGMKLMAKYLEGDKSGIPENKLIIVPTKIIDKANVDAVRGRAEGRHQRLTTGSLTRRRGANVDRAGRFDARRLYRAHGTIVSRS